MRLYRVGGGGHILKNEKNRKKQFKGGGLIQKNTKMAQKNDF